MIKKTMSLLMLLCALMTAPASKAQEATPLPLQPEVKSGVLPNGLSYYILHNEEPKNRANFYIAQKVGSTLEEPSQAGLAHFLEHMAFNGTAHYPGDKMLEYLKSKGIRFGADINAYTFYDETVYNINNVPTTDQALMDSVLLCIYDWSGSILLEDAEIDAERGIIESEWRDRNDASFRLLEYALPKIYTEANYQIPVIGKIDVIRNFPYDEIKNYYKKWYRPDQQGIVIVGDFNADEMEAKVKDLFSKIPMPENAAPREYPTVSDNKEPIYVYFEDPETMYPMVRLAFKYDKTPFEMRNTVEAFAQDEVLETVVTTLINNRLNEYSQKAECKYAYAGVAFGDFWISKTKGAFNVTVIGKEGTPLQEAFAEAMGIVTRACKTGFTDSELSRVRDEILSRYEKAANESDKTNSDVLGKKLYRHFIDNKPAPGAQISFQLAQQILPQIPVQAVNQVATGLLTPENQVMVVAQPKRDGYTVIEEKDIMGSLQNILNAEYEAYQEEPITMPMVSKYLKAGKVVATKAGEFGTTVFTLSNGATVIVKPTDFKADEVRFQAFSKQGIRTYPESKALDIKLAEDAFNCSKLGNYDKTTLNRYLSGKQVAIGFDYSTYTASLSGSSTVKDLPVLMEMIYASFVDLNPDPETFDAAIQQARTMLTAYGKSPEYIYQTMKTKIQYGNNPLMNDLELKDLDNVNYASILATVKESLSNAADFTFVFVGNVNPDELKENLEKYIASIPGNAKKKNDFKVMTPIKYAKTIKEEWKQEMQTPATFVYNLNWTGDKEYNVKNNYLTSIAGSLLGNIFTKTLREEEGGAYSPAALGYQSYDGDCALIYQFQTKQEMQDRMIARALKELNNLLTNGADPDDFAKIKEQAVKKLENDMRTNGYWLNGLNVYSSLGINKISHAEETLKSITLDEMNAFLKSLTQGMQSVEVIMEGIPTQK